MRQEFLAKSKVGQYDVALRVEKNIFQLDIAVDDAELSYWSKANQNVNMKRKTKEKRKRLKTTTQLKDIGGEISKNL